MIINLVISWNINNVLCKFKLIEKKICYFLWMTGNNYKQLYLFYLDTLQFVSNIFYCVFFCTTIFIFKLDTILILTIYNSVSSEQNYFWANFQCIYKLIQSAGIPFDFHALINCSIKKLSKLLVMQELLHRFNFIFVKSAN